jgi:hypothetical protein
LSRGRAGPRGAAAGIALAAAGVIYSRLTGRRLGAPDPGPDAEPQPRGLGEPPPADAAPGEDVERARSELADELARRAAHGDV